MPKGPKSSLPVGFRVRSPCPQLSAAAFPVLNLTPLGMQPNGIRIRIPEARTTVFPAA
jgi:hypothetical protein